MAILRSTAQNRHLLIDPQLDQNVTIKFSRFARQFQPSSGILQLMNDLGEAVTEDGDICMLGGGNPARIGSVEAVFRREMEQLMQDGDAFEQMVARYDDPAGNRLFRQWLAEFLSEEYGWAIDGDNIALTNGSQSAFGILFNALAGQGEDGVQRRLLLPVTPEYIGYADVGIGEQEIFTANRPAIELRDDHRFKYRVDFDTLSVGEDVAAICVSRPTNPSGNVVTDREIAKLTALAEKQDIPLIIDGAYGLPFPGIIFSEATLSWNPNTILCLSLSKLGLPGVRTGIVIADKPLVELMTGASAINTLSPGSFGPNLVRELVRSREIVSLSRSVIRPWYEARCAEVVSRVLDEMHDLPVRVHEPEGAIFLWLWFEALPITSQTLYQRLKQRGVFVIAGEHFFPGLEDPLDSPWQHRHECIRVSYAAAHEDVDRGIGIIGEEVRRAYQDA